MSLFVKQNESRSELQDKLAKELQDRAREKAKEAELPDGVTDSAYIKGTQETSRFGWVWILIIAGVVVAAIIAIIVGM